jgi:hypothetical protein
VAEKEAFTVEIDQVSSSSWNQLLLNFADASLYQTWEYGRVRWGGKNLHHMVLKNGDRLSAICQVAIKKAPLVPLGIAFVSWGPLWRPFGCDESPDRFTAAIRALKREYAVRRNLVLRIDPGEIAPGTQNLAGLLEAEGFSRTDRRPYTTIIMDLSHDIDTIRKEMHHKWRTHLNKAEKNGLVVEERTDQDVFDVFLTLSDQMIDRKKFVPGVDYREFRQIFQNLPPELNMRVLVCKKDGEPVSIAIYSKIGNRGIYLLGATGNNGLELRGSNLLHWEIIKRLKAAGCAFYDLGGVNPQTNPGVFRFKEELAGKNGSALNHIGEHEYCENRASRLFVSWIENLRMR